MKLSKAEKLLTQPASDNKRVKTNLSFREELYTRFKKFCDDRGVPVTDLLEAIMEDYLEHMNREPGKKRKKTAGETSLEARPKTTKSKQP